MTTNQLKNLAYFTVLIGGESHVDEWAHSPDYVVEKYNTFIGVNKPNQDGVVADIPLISYLSKWGYSTDYNNHVFNYMSEILTIKQSKTIGLSDMIQVFENCIGDINSICNDNHLHRPIHVVLRDQLFKPFFERKDNLRILKLCDILDNNIF